MHKITQRPLISGVTLVCLIVLGQFSFALGQQQSESYTPGFDVKTYTRATLDTWLRVYGDAKPSFKPGDVLTAKDLDRIRPFVPPGTLEQLNFPEMRMKIAPTADRKPRADFLACSEKYGNQVRLTKDGTLENYVCGQPFPNSSLSTSDPLSGIKAAWNFEYRWQNYGLVLFNIYWIWERPGPSHNGMAPKGIELPPKAWLDPDAFKITTALPADLSANYGGGGTYQRTLVAMHQRVYFTHLAPLADRGGTLPVPHAEDFEYKEYTGFFSPFDIRGTVFIIFRYSDPYRPDDAWAYIPTIRRVRRISAEVRSDSLLGTDITLDDFYSFAGKEVEWNFKFLGWKEVLAVDPGTDYAHFYGPNGTIPDDRWSLRRYAVVERTPKSKQYPYNSVVMFWDAENFYVTHYQAFDRAGKLWKTFLYGWKWSEDFKDFQEINHGARASAFQFIPIVDLQNARATIITGAGGGFPDADPQHVQALYDINRLEEIHR